MDQHVIQIEVDRSLYMDEVRVRPKANFDEFARELRPVVAKLTRVGSVEGAGHRNSDLPAGRINAANAPL